MSTVAISASVRVRPTASAAAAPMICRFCDEVRLTNHICNEPEVLRICEETREAAYDAYTEKDENILLTHLRCCQYDEIKILYMYWKETAPPRIQTKIETSIAMPDLPLVCDICYSKTIALNMWLYLYIEIYQLRANEGCCGGGGGGGMCFRCCCGLCCCGLNESTRNMLMFWYNVWNGNTPWSTTRIIDLGSDSDLDSDSDYYNSDSDFDFQVEMDTDYRGVTADDVDSYIGVDIDTGHNAHVLGARSHSIDVQFHSENIESCHECNECPICGDGIVIDKKVLLTCGHSLCSDCFEKYIEYEMRRYHQGSLLSVLFCCSICRGDINSVSVFSLDVKLRLTQCGGGGGGGHDSVSSSLDIGLIDALEMLDPID